MEQDWFVSDLHLGHKFCVKDRGFSSVEAMNETIFQMFNVVGKGDRVFILGDISYENALAHQLIQYLIMKRKVGDLYIIEGNHDKRHWLHTFTFTHPRLHICQTMYVKGNTKYHDLFLSHYQHVLWDRSHYGCYHLYGHQHKHTSDVPMSNAFALTGKKMCVNCELSNYKLLSRDDIEEYMKKQPHNLDQYLVRGNKRQKKLVIKTMKRLGNIISRLQKKLEKLGDFKVPERKIENEEVHTEETNESESNSMDR